MKPSTGRCVPGTGVVIVVVVFIVSCLSFAEGYSKGAPFSTCLTMFPKHGPTERQAGPSPYRIVLSPHTYRPGQDITVELRSTDGRPVKGLQVKATRSSGDRETAVGSFIRTPANITKVFTCEGGYKNIVTHTTSLAGPDSKEALDSITLVWKAPNTNVGDIIFVATFVESFLVFWTGMTATLKAENQQTVDHSLNTLPETNGVAFDSVILSTCGTDKGCFLYPRYCSGSDCVAAATFRQDGDHFRFELMAKKSTYVSVGFSDDVKMGEDETITCTAEDHGVISVQHGFNPKRYNQRIVRYQLSDLAVNRTDGDIICSFRRPRVAVTRFANQSAPDLQYINATYDLHNEYYLMLAWGTVKNETDVMNKHKELPPVTDSKVSVRNYAIYRGSSLPVEARIHGSLMVVAWVLLAGLTTVMSRYYKHWLPNRLYFQSNIWFQIHRTAAIAVGVLTISSIILMLAYVGGFAEKEQKHAIVGFTVLTLVIAQIVAGVFRPDKSSHLRPYFRYTHMIMGYSAHILSAAALYLAFDIRFIPEVMRFFGVTVLTGWVPVQIAWTIVLELRRCCTVDKEPVKEKEPWRQALTSADSLLLFFYCLTLVLLGSSTLSAILVF